MNPVYDLLTKNSLNPGQQGSDFTIKCLNPEHNDSDPSLRIDKITGMMHCFACGFKGNIFSYYGIKNNFVSIKVQLLKEKLRKVAMSNQDLEFPTGIVPFKRKYRDISGKTYESFEAFTSVSQQDNFMDRVFFPIKNVQNRIVAFIGRCTRGDNSRKSKYYIYPSKAPLPLYPSIFPERPNSVVLVEGIFDMLNLHDKGVSNAACVFGVDTMANTMGEHLMPIKAQNISKIYLMFDGDAPGRIAMKKIKPLIEAEGFYCEIVELPDGADPGNMDQEAVDTLKEYINA